jgi:hypothetical protein
MGTYIYIRGTLTIKKSQIDDAMKAIKDLNNHDELKRGGSKTEKWFAWVPEDYDQKVETLEDVFSMVLGFDMSIDNENDDKITYSFNYSDKWGQHEVFFVTLAPFCESLVIDHLCDELEYEQQKWTIALNPETKKVHILEPVITIIYPDMDESNEITVDSFRPISY